MATKTSTINLFTLSINRVESQAAYDQMVASGEITENELYFVEGDTIPSAYAMTFTTSDWSSQAITLSAFTHGCGTAPLVQVQVLSGSTYKVYHGYPSESWTVSIDSSGNITLSVASGSEFSGRLVVR